MGIEETRVGGKGDAVGCREVGKAVGKGGGEDIVSGVSVDTGKLAVGIVTSASFVVRVLHDVISMMSNERSPVFIMIFKFPLTFLFIGITNSANNRIPGDDYGDFPTGLSIVFLVDHIFNGL
jgi:hypothetical protein